MAFTEDLSVFLDLNGFGVPVTAGAVSGVGILDQNSEIALGGEAVFIDYLLIVQASIFGNLTYGDTITVDGASYKVEHQPMRFDDGAFCKVPLMKVEAVSNNITTLSGLRLVTQDCRYLVTLAS
jgi:hypothetical protein